MKFIRLPFAASLVAFGIGSAALSQKPAATPAPAADPFLKTPGAGAEQAGELEWDAPENLTFVFELFALNKEDALSIIEKERNSAARYERVVALFEGGKARLETLSCLATLDGDRAVTEYIDEVRYPTEFQPGNSKSAPAAAATFETRNVGDTFEIEGQLAPDQRVCDLQIVPQKGALLGFRDTAPPGSQHPILQPRFLTQKLTTSTMAFTGKPHYLGSMSAATEHAVATGGIASEVSMAFIRVYVVPIDAAFRKATPAPASVGTVGLEYSFYSLDRARAREVLAALPDMEGPWVRLQSFLKQNEARFEHVVTLRTRSGVRAVTESIREERYPTEFFSPDRIGEGTPGVPSAHETRNAGVTVELEPTMSPNWALCYLRHVAQSVTYRGLLKVEGSAWPHPDQPLFETRKITSSMNLIVGKTALAGTFNPPGANGVNGRQDDGRTWLAFVRCVLESE
ncbi:MAG: hypothetical protein M3463_20135 [Verrucomicrobiota bacterium]|nr:hypothetical protein [Verrucomicrobiota bacterium]